MELNKCRRCGAFFVTNNNVCPNCQIKDNTELSKLKDYLSENDCPSSIENLATSTGISEKNLTRFLEMQDFSSYTSILENNTNINL